MLKFCAKRFGWYREVWFWIKNLALFDVGATQNPHRERERGFCENQSVIIMALGKMCRSNSLKRSVSFGATGGEVVRALGRKRIEVSVSEDDTYSSCESSLKTPLLKKQRSGGRRFGFFRDEEEASSQLEALSQEILIKILCGVDHEDLKQLFHVSKPIREATLIAKQLHFAYSTPRKIRAFRTKIDFSESNEEDLMEDIEASNAPRQQRVSRPVLSRKKLQEISVNLMDSLEEGMRKGLFMDDDDEE